MFTLGKQIVICVHNFTVTKMNLNTWVLISMLLLNPTWFFDLSSFRYPIFPLATLSYLLGLWLHSSWTCTELSPGPGHPYHAWKVKTVLDNIENWQFWLVTYYKVHTLLSNSLICAPRWATLILGLVIYLWLQVGSWKQIYLDQIQYLNVLPMDSYIVKEVRKSCFFVQN